MSNKMNLEEDAREAISRADEFIKTVDKQLSKKIKLFVKKENSLLLNATEVMQGAEIYAMLKDVVMVADKIFDMVDFEISREIQERATTKDIFRLLVRYYTKGIQKGLSEMHRASRNDTN